MKFGLKIISLNFLVVFLTLMDQWLKDFFIKNEYFYVNPNIAFGIEIPRFIIYALVGVILFALILWLVQWYKQKKAGEIFAVSLMIFGAISNIIDRVRFGQVIDYINFPNFSVFNLADAMIVAGACLVALKFLKQK